MSPTTTSSPEFEFTFLKPRYWPTWILLGLLWCVSCLPRKWVMSLGRFVGDQMRKRNTKRRHIAEVNLRLCFPELSENERQAVLIRHFHCFGQAMMDMGLSMMSNIKRIRKHLTQTGMSNMTALPEGKRGILIAYHTITLELGGFSTIADIDTVSMMKRDKNPLLNWLMYRARTREGNLTIYMRDQGLRGIVSGMKKGKLCFIIPDEDFGEARHSVYAPFFGQNRATLNIVSRIAKITNAVVLPSFCRLDSRDGTYHTEILSPLTGFPSGDDVADAKILNLAMETLIRKAPEQYLWTFRWFRTREDGTDPYA